MLDILQSPVMLVGIIEIVTIKGDIKAVVFSKIYR